MANLDAQARQFAFGLISNAGIRVKSISSLSDQQLADLIGAVLGCQISPRSIQDLADEIAESDPDSVLG